MSSALAYAKTMSESDRAIFMQAYHAQARKEGTAFLLAWFCLDRVYLGEIFTTIIKIVSCFFLIGFLWIIIDLFTVKSRTKTFNNWLAYDLKTEMGL